MSQGEYRTLGIFPVDSLNRMDELVEFLTIITKHGPDTGDIGAEYRAVDQNKSIDRVSLTRLEAMGTIEKVDGGMRVTELGHRIIEGEVEPLVEALCDTFIGFYDTLAILAASSTRVGMIRSLLNNAHGLDWGNPTEPKRRLDWLRDMNLAELEEGSNEYALTEAGENIVEYVRDRRGDPAVASLFSSNQEQHRQTSKTEPEIAKHVSARADQPEARTKQVNSEENPEHPFAKRTERKVLSIHIDGRDDTFGDYRQLIETDTSSSSVEWLSTADSPGKTVRFWETDEESLDRVGGLARGDVILFHHHDGGYMTIGQVLTVQQRDAVETEADRFILFESIHSVDDGVRESVTGLIDWSAHMNETWVRVDTKEVLKERHSSIEGFIENAKGEIDFDYWSGSNWAVDEDFSRKLIRQLHRKGQAIIYGPPGTGKTFNAESFAQWWTGKQETTIPTKSQTESITFHPSYSYEDFVEGYTITAGETRESDGKESVPDGGDAASNNSPYGLKRGIFRQFCENARQMKEATDADQSPPRYVLVIDELNRGNVPQIFGESVTILDKDKRGSYRKLSHSGDSFTIPENVYVIATMNTADQSITQLDAAIRRRFASMQLPPNCDVFYDLEENAYPNSRENAAELVSSDRADTKALIAASVLALEIINKQLIRIPSLGKGKRIGHAYLLPTAWRNSSLNVEEDTAITDIWRYDILPLLEEYFFQDVEALEREIFSGESQFVNQETNDITKLDSADLRKNLKMFVLDNQEVLDVEFEGE